MERKLSAILVADVAGCSRLMAQDEAARLEQLAEPGGTAVSQTVVNHVNHS